MFYLTCSMIPGVDLAHNGVDLAHNGVDLIQMAVVYSVVSVE